MDGSIWFIKFETVDGFANWNYPRQIFGSVLRPKLTWLLRPEGTSLGGGATAVALAVDKELGLLAVYDILERHIVVTSNI